MKGNVAYPRGGAGYYRSGFNGKRKDDEIHGATGTSYDFDARMLDVRVGRWLSVDPLAAADPDWTPYRFGYNNPIFFIDPNGMREDGWTVDVETGETNRINDHGGDETQFISYVQKGENGGLVHKGQQVIEGNGFHVGKHSEGYGASRFNLWKDMPAGLKGYDNLPYEYDWSDLKMRYGLLEGGGILSRALQGLERNGIAEPLTADNYWSHYGHTLGNLKLMGTYVPAAAGLASAAQWGRPQAGSVGSRYFNARAGITITRAGGPDVQFGNNPNQVHHAFRHTDQMGLDRSVVQSTIRSHLGQVHGQIQTGQPFNQVIRISGMNVQYTAFRLESGSINVGRIHGAP